MICPHHLQASKQRQSQSRIIADSLSPGKQSLVASTLPKRVRLLSGIGPPKCSNLSVSLEQNSTIMFVCFFLLALCVFVLGGGSNSTEGTKPPKSRPTDPSRSSHRLGSFCASESAAATFSTKLEKPRGIDGRGSAAPAVPGAAEMEPLCD